MVAYFRPLAVPNRWLSSAGAGAVGMRPRPCDGSVMDFGKLQSPTYGESGADQEVFASAEPIGVEKRCPLIGVPGGEDGSKFQVDR